jgi:hypothetical protein
MTLTQHVAATAVVAVPLSTFLGVGEMVIFAVGSILIDVDHYLFYVARTGRYGIRGMFRYFTALQPVQRMIPYVGVCIFHTVDFFLLVSILAYWYPVLLPLLAGMLFHFIMDVIDLNRKGIPFIRAYFLIEHFMRRRDDGYPYY